DFIDFEDEAVWNSMRENNIGVFQMEGDRAGKLLSDMLSPETIRNIRSNEAGKGVKYMDLLSLVNAAQRPAGSSYVDAVTHGRFKDNGHSALNKFLAPTLGNLVYQEQILNFLVDFCGYSAGRADVIRRGIG
ncbi:DNA polymerase III subunit alpha, partial [Limosilactobacillus reuteri]